MGVGCVVPFAAVKFVPNACKGFDRRGLLRWAHDVQRRCRTNPPNPQQDFMARLQNAAGGTLRVIRQMTPTRSGSKVENESTVDRTFAAWLRSPRQVASICESSRYTASAVVGQCRLPADATVVELGPGGGAITWPLLSTLGPAGRLLAIEKTPILTQSLRQCDDRRLSVIQGDAAEMTRCLRRYGNPRCDAVVSGIPFSYLDDDTAAQIIEQVHAVLRPGGRFVAYQMRKDVCRFANPVFGRPETRFVWRNVPPLRVLTWQKTA